MNQAKTWEEFRAATAFNNMPSENMVWVDRQGTIGWQAAGIQPIRRNWSGILPVPGDGRYEWDGFLPITSLPSEANPDRGFIATANNFLMPKDYPYKDLLQVTWSDPFRASRIDCCPHRPPHLPRNLMTKRPRCSTAFSRTFLFRCDQARALTGILGRAA